MDKHLKQEFFEEAFRKYFDDCEKAKIPSSEALNCMFISTIASTYFSLSENKEFSSTEIEGFLCDQFKETIKIAKENFKYGKIL